MVEASPDVADIEQLLNQCTPEELASILQSIEDGASGQVAPQAAGACQDTAASGAATAAQRQPASEEPPAVAAAPKPSPAPPSAPPPTGAGRRPAPGVRHKQAEADASTVAAADLEVAGDNHQLTMDEIKRLLQEHSAGMMSEVRKLVTAPPAQTQSALQPVGGDKIDMGTLTQALAERDREVKMLEARLAELQGDLEVKDKRVAELGADLDITVREVRHRQLDLEFQQLKLEERVRSNAELEQAQRNLTARVEEASLNARHAALDADAGRQMMTPRSQALRAQGSLPWTLRKNRLPAMGMGSEAN